MRSLVVLETRDQLELEERCEFHIVLGYGWASVAGRVPAEVGGRERGGQTHQFGEPQSVLSTLGVGGGQKIQNISPCLGRREGSLMPTLWAGGRRVI